MVGCSFFTAEDLENHHLFFFLREMLFSAHHGNSETMSVRARSVRGRAVEEKGRAILNPPLHGICIRVYICYLKEEKLWQFLLLAVFQQVWSWPEKVRVWGFFFLF